MTNLECGMRNGGILSILWNDDGMWNVECGMSNGGILRNDELWNSAVFTYTCTERFKVQCSRFKGYHRWRLLPILIKI
jgi:hypothetical protein